VRRVNHPHAHRHAAPRLGMTICHNVDAKINIINSNIDKVNSRRYALGRSRRVALAWAARSEWIGE
jgi:hypothetical protein